MSDDQTTKAKAATRPSKKARRDAPTLPAHIVRRSEWNGLRTGDQVDVAGLVKRGARWEFVAHVRNERNGSEYIEVVGGSDHDRSLRSFSPEQIYPARSLRGRSRRRPAGATQPPLAQAPQLPLG